MDSLLPPLLAAFLAEWGDRTQLLAMMLALRFRGDRRILIGIGLAALVNGLLATVAGHFLVGYINFRAMTLMMAVALVFAGLGGFMPQKPPKLGKEGGANVILGSFLGFWALEFGDKTQFVTMTLAARADSLVLAAIGMAAGVVLANVAPVLLADKMPAKLPIRSIRLGAASLLMIAGVLAGVSALQIV